MLNRIVMIAGVVLTVAGFIGCYAGRDCKPGDACWQDCTTNPSGQGCVDPWQPEPIGAKPDAGQP